MNITITFERSKANGQHSNTKTNSNANPLLVIKRKKIKHDTKLIARHVWQRTHSARARQHICILYSSFSCLLMMQQHVCTCGVCILDSTGCSLKKRGLCRLGSSDI